jgi:hypothetical protein
MTERRALWLASSFALLFLAAWLVFAWCEASAARSPEEVSADGQGVAALIPSELQAGITETFCLVYTATGTIATGGSLRAHDPDFNGMGWTMWQEFDDAEPCTSGCLTVSSTNLTAELGVVRYSQGGPQQESYTTVYLTSGTLLPNDIVTLCYAQGRTPHKSYRDVEWKTLVDADGDATYAPLDTSPRLRILPQPVPSLMVATAPTYVEAGVPFPLTVRALDEYSNPCSDYVDTMTFTSTAASADLPPPDSPFPPGTGVHEYPITINATGIHYVYVSPAGPLPTIRSNPLVVVDSLEGKQQLYWGDLHAHHGHIFTTTLGLRVDEFMEYARDVSDLDFVCESHKSSSYWNTMETHAELEASVQLYSAPGQFITFRGYEWMGNTSLQGHHNFYFDGPSAGDMIYSPDDDTSDTLDEMWWLLEENLPSGGEAIGLPHALLTPPSGSGSNWRDFDQYTLNSRYRPLVEIYSHWGSSETGAGSAREALVFGSRVGFYGSSDTHFAYPGNPQTEAWGSRGTEYVAGLAAVRATELTREALWGALTNRQTYATEGERIFLDVSVDGYPMGSQIASTSDPSIVVTAAGTAPISQVLVFKGAYVTTSTVASEDINDYFTILLDERPDALYTTLEVTDTDFDSNAFYYVRIVQTDGKRAWASPIWVDYGAPQDLWSSCGDGGFDPGESLVTCPADTQLAQRSWMTYTLGAPRVWVDDLSSPRGTEVSMVGLHVYNVSNITSYVPYGTPAWLPFMQQHVTRVVESGLSYLGFGGVGANLYIGDPYPTPVTLTNPLNWDLDQLDQLLDFAAHRGVYILPTINASRAPSWWYASPAAHQDMIQLDNKGTRWEPTASFNNPEYWAAIDPILAHIVARYREHPALLGWDVRVGEGENNYPPPYVIDPHNPPDTWCDYSPFAEQKFQDWLTDRYGDDEALQQAWMTDSVTLADAAIPQPLGGISPSSPSEMVPYLNGSADTRPQVRDWLVFRLDEKWAETDHFVQLFRGLDPKHIVLNDPAYHPLPEADPRSGRHDGDRAYRSSHLDAVIHHPRISDTDVEDSFNTQRSTLYASDLYALGSGKLAMWVNEETSEVHTGVDQDNIWRMDSVAILHAAAGQGDGWVTGDDKDPRNELPSWSATERAEMRRLSPIFSAPDLRAPQPKIAILADDFHEGFNYPLEGQVAFTLGRHADRARFVHNLFQNGLDYTYLTTGDVLAEPSRLQDYQAVLVMNLQRLEVAVAEELDAYRDGGGGLFIAGVTGTSDEYGLPDTTALSTLLDATVTGFITGETEIASWQFDQVDPLTDYLLSAAVSDNLYYIPVLTPGSGYTELAHLSTGGGEPVVGYQGNTVFWFPRLSIDDSDQIQFQRNLWDFFDVEPVASASISVEASGGSYKSIFTPAPVTVSVALDDGPTSVLVWDWNRMELVDVVAPVSGRQASLRTSDNASYLLGVTQRSHKVQLVALSGGSLGEVAYDVPGQSMAVGVYHTAPGQPVNLAFYLGGSTVGGLWVSRATVTDRGLDPTGRVYLVTVAPLEKRLTVTLKYNIPSVPTTGGSVYPTPGTEIVVPPHAFTDTVAFHMVDVPPLPTGPLAATGLFFDLFASLPGSGTLAGMLPGQRITITVTYDESELPPGIDESELALYAWDGGEWVEEPTSVVDVDQDTVTASPDHLSLWAVLYGRQEALYLPLIERRWP